MKEVVSEPVEPWSEELPPFELTDPDAKKYTLSLKIKKTSRFYHKILHLDDNTDLNLLIELVK